MVSRSFVVTFSQMDIEFSFCIYWNVCVQLPHLTLDSFLSCVCLLGYFIVSKSVFFCCVAFKIEGIPSIKWAYVIILMDFYF